MSAARNVGIGVAALAGTVLVAGVLLPSRYTVSRSVVIDVPVDVVFDQIIDVKRAEAWSVWKAEDPSMAITYDTITAGEGAHYSWTSEKMGAGSYTITRVEFNRRVVGKLEMEDGSEPAETTFLLEEVDQQTRVTWSLDGKQSVPVLGPYLALGMNRIVGPSFEKGLQMLSQAAKEAQVAAEKRAKELAAMKAAADAARIAEAARAEAAAKAAAQQVAAPTP